MRPREAAIKRGPTGIADYGCDRITAPERPRAIQRKAAGHTPGIGLQPASVCEWPIGIVGHDRDLRLVLLRRYELTGREPFQFLRGRRSAPGDRFAEVGV